MLSEKPDGHISSIIKSIDKAGMRGLINIAFDEWREAEIARLAEERRKLEEAMRDFEDYKREIHRAKDKTEFDEFMAERKRKPAPRSSDAEDAT